MDSSVETAQNISLVWPQNSLEFEFAGLSYNQPNKNRYAYMLEGFDTSWHFIGTKRNGRYTNLPGGKYTLLLKASNSDGVWNETPVRVAVNVIPPFWQTAWFQVVLSLTVVNLKQNKKYIEFEVPGEEILKSVEADSKDFENLVKLKVIEYIKSL